MKSERKRAPTRGGCCPASPGDCSRGFVFTIDATLALFLMVLVLATVAFLSSQSEDNPYVKLQVLREAKDTLIVMERQGALSSGNRTLIEGTLNSTLPKSIGAHLQMNTYYLEEGGFALMNITDYGESAPGNITVYGARLDFVALKGGHIANYSIVRMTVWQK